MRTRPSVVALRVALLAALPLACEGVDDEPRLARLPDGGQVTTDVAGAPAASAELTPVGGRLADGRIVLGYFEGRVDPERGALDVRVIPREAVGRTVDGADTEWGAPELPRFAVREQALCDETDYVTVQDGNPGVGPADSLEVVTAPASLAQDLTCDGAWIPLFDPPLFCADVTIRSFYTSLVLESVYAEILSMSDVNHLAWNGDAEPDPGNPPSGAWGLWSYGDLAVVSGAPANAGVRRWIFERNNDTFYSFQGRVVGAAVESCDNVDNDCNGSIDDDGLGGPLTQVCYSGPGGTLGVGLCVGGTSSCAAGSWGGCLGEVLPSAESCDDFDNDCDGVTDEGCDDDDDDWCDGGMATVGNPSQCPLGGGDCDDSSASVGPGASETCDDVDDDCDSIIDEGCDDDNDSWCDSGMATVGFPGACPSGGGDCADVDGSVNPGAAELCDDLNNDCDAGTDEGCDDDGDDYCDVSMTRVGTPSTCVTGGGDCVDTMGSVNPGATETCDGLDNDCDGQTDEGCDDDGDDYCDVSMTTPGPTGVCPFGGGDCDDTASGLNPGMPEQCDDIDNNCGGGTDEGCDDDNDDYCDSGMVRIGTPSTCTAGGNDCTDNNAAINPGATEVCDDLDNDCDLANDELCDLDNDDWCNASMVRVGTPSTCVSGGGDCNDVSAIVHPAATEICDNVDNNCASGVDEGCDDDNDNWCDASMTVSGSPSTCTSGNGDCADTVPTVNPGVTEVCDDVDNDCNSGPDEGCDDDNDNYCDASMTRIGTPSTCTAGGNDCNDLNVAIRPGATETCDNNDNNCSGSTDEGCDDDNDNYCDIAMTRIGTPTTCTAGGNDCNDFNGSIYPGAMEVPADGLDQDCDARDNCYQDSDNDGYRPNGVSWVLGNDMDCTDPAEAIGSDPTTDCDDSEYAVYPGATERCDALDNDCDAATDESACPGGGCSGFRCSGTSYFSCSTLPLTYAQATTSCTNQTASVVIPNDNTELACVNANAGNAYWIGYRDADSDGDLEWNGGQISTATQNWQSGEPNNLPGSCVTILTGTFKWWDYACTQNTGIYTLCEFPY